MRRPRKQATGPPVSLFPFLAVLICTMGVLIIMLVLAVQSSVVEARKEREEQKEIAGQQREELLDEIDLEQYRIEQITRLRPGLADRLRDSRLRRSHLDDEIRDLIDQAQKLATQFQQLEQGAAQMRKGGEADTLLADELQQMIEERQFDLEKLRETVADRPSLYSIVPVQTASGTNRRPIYVECRPGRIILQPAGIEIPLSDFALPILPGNPLDAALLATREYWNRFQAGSPEGDPYPLIIVRPGGASAYAIARRAMSSWDDEFGYELVDDSKQLDWGESDANLDATLRRAIEIAMVRQQQFVASGRASWEKGSGGQTGSQASGSTSASGAPGLSGQQIASGNSQQLPVHDGMTESPGLESNQTAGMAGSKAGEQTVQAGIDTTRNDSLSRFAMDNRTSQARAAARGNPLRRNAANRSSSADNEDSSVAARSATNEKSSENEAESDAIPLALSRGQDWALPTRTPGATPYRRPIRVECNDDHYLLYSSDPEQVPRRVEITDTVDQAIDELVNQVWVQIEGWGMAEIGGFWKPVLRVTTGFANGKTRAEELSRKMEGSGFEIERLWR